MTPAFWGLLTAMCWGSADFIARFTGRAVGHHAALFGMLLISAIVFSVIFLFAEQPFIWKPSGLGLLFMTGLGVMAGTLLLYWGLARGPVTIVSPIVASYPVINVLYAVLIGHSPTIIQWVAMGGVMGGVYVVARSVGHYEGKEEYSLAGLQKTVLISVAAALVFGVTVISLQEAGQIYGELQTVFVTRWISLAAIFVVVVWRGKAPSVGGRWWPWLCLQGLLDGGAYLFLVIGGEAAGGEIAAVVASAFSAVTIILARMILKEAMSALQWAGVALIIVGVGVLLAP